MIRHRDFKLILPKYADSPIGDMMYNLKWDPFEMRNLLGVRTKIMSDEIVGKAEHLKILLLEWMKR